MRLRLVGRRDVLALAIATAMAALGSMAARAYPLMLLHQPGWEVAAVLKFIYSPSGPAYRGIVISETPVFLTNILLWTGLILVGSRLYRAVGAAWRRSHLRWAALVALFVSLLSELASYDNYALPFLPTLARPGWAFAPRISPITNFVIDFRSPLELFWYPDRLLTTSLAFAFNFVFWFSVFLFVTLAAGRILGRRSLATVG